jgi:hypothetical protein
MRRISPGVTARAHLRAPSAPTSTSRRAARGALGATSALTLASALGCSPTVDLLGVYFPAWLISAVVGLVVAYAAVWWLGRRSGRRALAQSGLLFCSLTVTVAMLTWWLFFSSF